MRTVAKEHVFYAGSWGSLPLKKLAPALHRASPWPGVGVVCYQGRPDGVKKASSFTGELDGSILEQQLSCGSYWLKLAGVFFANERT